MHSDSCATPSTRLDLWERIYSGKYFTEAELRGGLVEFLRKEQASQRKVKRLCVSPTTFNQRLMTIRQFLSWCFDMHLSSIALDDYGYERIREQQQRNLKWLSSGFISAPPANKGTKKGLTEEEVHFLIRCLDPSNPKAVGRNHAVRVRNYVMVMLMLNYGMRPGEVLSLRVEDVELGAISAIRVQRRLPDSRDTRKPRPQIKRNGRVMPIDNAYFCKMLDEYIMETREVLEAPAEEESDYLILSDEGKPLSQPSITQFFQILRNRFPGDLPAHLTAKALRHTFSSFMERTMRLIGLDEERRKQALATLRGDSSLTSQSVYLAQEIEEQAHLALKKLQQKLMDDERCSMESSIS